MFYIMHVDFLVAYSIIVHFGKNIKKSLVNTLETGA